MGDIRYALVSGEFLLHEDAAGRRRGFEPDGDSLAFRPARADLLRALGTPPRDAEFQRTGRVQIRLEGIDALELHYRGSHQQRPQCLRARDHLLDLLGFADVVFERPKATRGLPLRVRQARPHPMRGYIFTRQIDPNGRPVAFAFAGPAGIPDGPGVRLTAQRAGRSVNARLLAAGQAYPAFYRTLPGNLRAMLARRVERARAARLGVWSVDKTTTGVSIQDARTLTRAAIWPKLYRRLVDYLRAPLDKTSDGRAGFLGWLRDRRFDSRDDELIVVDRRTERAARLSDLLEVRARRVRMRVDPGGVVLSPR